MKTDSLVPLVAHAWQRTQSLGRHRGRNVERQLVTRAQQGERGAFDLLVSEIADRLYSVAYRILRNGPSAQDATQHAPVDSITIEAANYTP
jgi:hypothetical protein